MSSSTPFLQRECTDLSLLLDPAWAWQPSSRQRCARFAAVSRTREAFIAWRGQRCHWCPGEESPAAAIHDNVDPYLLARAYTYLAAELSTRVANAKPTTLGWADIQSIRLSSGFDQPHASQLSSTTPFLANELYQIHLLVRKAREGMSSTSQMLATAERGHVLLGDLRDLDVHVGRRTTNPGLPVLAASHFRIVGAQRTVTQASKDTGNGSTGQIYPVTVAVYRVDGDEAGELRLSHFPSFLTAQECFSAEPSLSDGRTWWGAVDLALELAHAQFKVLQSRDRRAGSPLQGHYALKWHIDFGRQHQQWDEVTPCTDVFKDDSHGAAFALGLLQALCRTALAQPAAPKP
jgi:hypothetical protein